MLELREIYKYYNPGTVNEMCLFNNFNFKVDDGEFVAVVGSNGSGKTSMLNIICGSIPIDEGAVLINGTNITNMPEYKRMGRIGRVFQNPSMGTCPSMTILENMAMAENKGKAYKGKAYNLGKGVNKKREEAYRELLRPLNLGLEDKLHVKVGALSGGQRQAMSLLMSTMTPLDFLILDEPTRGIDIGTKTEIQKLVLDLADQGMAVTFISSEVEEMLRTCSRMAVLRDGQKVGELEEDELSQSGVMKAIAGGDDK